MNHCANKENVLDNGVIKYIFCIWLSVKMAKISTLIGGES